MRRAAGAPIRWALAVALAALVLADTPGADAGRVGRPGARGAGRRPVAQLAERARGLVGKRRAVPPRGQPARDARGKRMLAGGRQESARAGLRARLDHLGGAYFERQIEGQSRLIANISGQRALDAVTELAGEGSGVLQIVHRGSRDANHTMAIFEGKLLHTQYRTGTGNWRLRSWGPKLRPSQRKLYSAFIELTPQEAQTMREHLKRAWRDQGDERTAGPNWEKGKLAPESLGGCRAVNCVSTWTEMPLGAGGEPLWRIIGLPHSYSGNPKGLQQALESQSNARVFAIAVYGPQIAGFATNPDRAITRFDE